MIPLRWIILSAVQASALALAWHLGAGRVQGRWDAAELQRERATAVLGAQEARRQHRAGAEYAAQAAAIRASAALLLPEVRNELQHPVPCLAGPAPMLGDLPMPAGVLDRLRRAGADPGTE